MLHMIEHVFVEQSLVAAFAVVGAVMWISLLMSKRLSAGRIHGSAIAIVIGLVLAYVGGLVTGGQKGLADIPVFAGIGLMGGAMLRDFGPPPEKTEASTTSASPVRTGWTTY